MSSIIQGNPESGWNLTATQAYKLFKQNKIAEPTLNALKTYFVNEILIPTLQDIKTEKGLHSPNQISSLRHRIGPITVNGQNVDLKQINTLFKNIDKGKNITGSQVLDRTNVARREASTGFSITSGKMADFWDEMSKLKSERQEAIQFANPNEVNRINKKFDNNMKSLFKKNRKILPKVNNKPIEYDFNKLDQYGWTEGSSREGYLQWQKDVYNESQAQTRAAAQQLGLKFDAGHTLALGGMEISEAERQKFNIPKDELELSDDGKSWILRGTNSASNLAIEIAKLNRSKGNLSPRNIEDIMQINTAFTKSLSLAEYNLRDNKTFRQPTDYSRAFRSLMAHNPDIDMNQLISQAEDELLLTGIQETPATKLSQVNVKNQLSNTTSTRGDLKSYTERLGNQTSVRYNDPHLMRISSNPEAQGLANKFSIGPEFFNKAHSATQQLGSFLGGPFAKVATVDKAINSAVEGDTVGAAVNTFKALSHTENLPLEDTEKLLLTN